MRLTLRTLLCYLDEVLEPGDADALGQKIEQSQKARDMVHRIRSSVRKLRLDSPDVWAGDGSLDANTVADYLDNTLPDGQVADVESVCQESDVHLGEVAACHNVLTLVLGEPADVPSQMRERIYNLATLEGRAKESERSKAADAASGIAATADQAIAAATESTPAAPPVAEPPADAGKSKRDAEVPDYLRQGRPAWMPLAAVVAVVLLIAGVTYVFWPGSNDPHVADTTGQEKEGAKSEQAKSTEAEKQKSTGELFPTTTDGSDADTRDDTVDRTTQPPLPTGGEGEADTTNSRAGGDGGEVPITLPKDPETTVGDGGTAVDPPMNNPDESTADPDLVAVVPAPGAGDDDPALPPSERLLGHYMSSEEILCRFDQESAQWMRMPMHTPLNSGDLLRVLPTYRPQILLENKVQITVAGHAAIEMDSSADDEHPLIKIDYGRAVIATVGKPDAKVNLLLAGRQVQVTFENVAGRVAVDVFPFHQTGDDPAKLLPHVATDCYVTGGEVTWAEGDAAVTLAAGQMLRMLDLAPGEKGTFDEAPIWVKTNDISDIDRQGSATLHPLVAEDRPVALSLQELAEKDHRVEVRSLAMRSLSVLGLHDSIASSFGITELKSYWDDHLRSLRETLAGGPQTAAEVRLACQRQHGDLGEVVYRLLVGYSPEDLAAGGAEQLVKALDHQNLDVRVLAFNNLRQITGKTLQYNPHYPEARRKTAVLRWNEMLESGGVAYAEEMTRLPPRPIE